MLGVRVADSEKADLERAAEIEGLSLSTLLRLSALVFARDERLAARIRRSKCWKNV